MRTAPLDLFFLLCILVGAFGAGYTLAEHLHGDWLLQRSPAGCIAMDPSTGTLRGPWPPGADDRCHLGAFLWRQALIGRP